MAAAVVDAQRSHELRQRISQDQLAAFGLRSLGANPGQQQAREAAIGELVPSRSAQGQSEGTIYSLVLVLVSGVGAGQAAQCQQPRHESQIGVRFAGPDKLIHLIGLGEVVPCLGRSLEGFLSRSV